MHLSACKAPDITTGKLTGTKTGASAEAQRYCSNTDLKSDQIIHALGAWHPPCESPEPWDASPLPLLQHRRLDSSSPWETNRGGASSVRKILNVPFFFFYFFLFSVKSFFPGVDAISRGHLEADLAGCPLRGPEALPLFGTDSYACLFPSAFGFKDVMHQATHWMYFNVCLSVIKKTEKKRKKKNRKEKKIVHGVLYRSKYSHIWKKSINILF